MSPLAGALLIFFMRVIDMSLDTVRLIMTVRGRKLLAGGIGVVQALVFILAVSAVLKGPLTVGNVLGYSLGFGAGVMLGIYFEERLAIGHSMFRIYSPAHGHDIAEALRAAGHAATEFPAIGRDGTLVVVNCAVSRRNASAVRAVIEGVDPGAFVTVDEVRPMQRGYFSISACGWKPQPGTPNLLKQVAGATVRVRLDALAISASDFNRRPESPRRAKRTTRRTAATKAPALTSHFCRAPLFSSSRDRIYQT